MKTTTAAIRKASKQFKRLIDKLPQQQVVLLVTISGFAALGAWLLVTSQAATPVISGEPETGVLTPGATTVTDGTASGGAAIRFGAATNPYACPAPYPTLRSGTTGPCVQRVQWYLN
ncbi:MAG TPA: hypothetical protein VK978_05125, partial [Candidatus Saccharimonadales bacterium]|nr:hypothetical protein [Candidatus Saccharimonadales bacterium]